MIDGIKIEDIKKIALQAGEAILEIYSQDICVTYKEDDSPLTKADKNANEIICNSLAALYPHIPILSEENRIIEYDERKDWEYYWCIDPLDGTKEFIKKNGEFTVNIALIHKDTPILGVVYAPVLDAMYSAKKGEGAFLNGQRLPSSPNTFQPPEALHVSQKLDGKLRVVASKSHLSKETQEFIDALEAKTIEQVSKGSSLKLCMVAEGSADIYPRLSPTMEWDTAAADAIVRESGKMSYQFDTDTPLVYNKENLLNPWFVVK